MSRLSSDIHKYLTDSVITKLFHRKIKTTTQFMDSDSEFLASFSSLQFKQILSIKDSILSTYASKMRTGDQYYNEILRASAILPLGLENMDNLLEGGWYTGCIYELCGASSTGKSQICIAAAASVVSHSPNGYVIYIDTKGDFSAERLMSNLENKVDLVGSSMAKVLVTQPQNPYELINFLYHHSNTQTRTDKNIRLIIIDSLPSLFFQYVGDHQESTSLLSTLSSLLKYMATEMHCSVLVTNLSTTWQGVDSEDCQRGSLGKFWEHIPTTRLTLSRFNGSQILVTVTKSSSTSLGRSVTLTIAQNGVS